MYTHNYLGMMIIYSMILFVFVCYRNITAFMTPRQEDMWNERGRNGRKYVIIVDCSCELDALSPVNAMKNILTKVCYFLR